MHDHVHVKNFEPFKRVMKNRNTREFLNVSYALNEHQTVANYVPNTIKSSIFVANIVAKIQVMGDFTGITLNKNNGSC